MVLIILGLFMLLLGGFGVGYGILGNFEALAENSFFSKLGDHASLACIIVGGLIFLFGLIMFLIGLKKRPKVKTLQLVESALMIAVAVVLNELLKIPSPLGGGLTVVSMLPLVLISHRYGAGWGLFTAFIFSLIELIFGLKNVGYASTALMAAGIIFLDYILAYSVIGLSGIFGKSRAAVATGIAVTFTLRFICHLVCGALIWKQWMPEEYMGMAMTNPWIYSALYNGWYMAAELVITMIVAMIIYKPLEKYFRGPAKAE
ncbi:MAG: energy-coupled thiamine transporter ThiT [Clostridia bacterium]|nr:energy-coupled thiamine transporter ThiT [Clostridia bacterium]